MVKRFYSLASLRRDRKLASSLQKVFERNLAICEVYKSYLFKTFGV